MAKIKKAKKMIKVHETKRKRNIRIKTEVKSRTKKAAAATENIQEAVKTAIIKADKAAAKKVIHKNKAARIKSKLMKKLHRSKTS